MSGVIKDLEKLKLIQYINLVFNNIQSGGNIGPKSRELINITPSNKTFSIWGIIYARLLIYVLTSEPCNVDESSNSLFLDSVTYNSNWINNFTKSDSRGDTFWDHSLENLDQLSSTLIKLIDSVENNTYNKETLKIYLTWVLIASSLQKLQIFNDNDQLLKRDNVFISQIINRLAGTDYETLFSNLSELISNGKINEGFFSTILPKINEDSDENKRNHLLLFFITTLDNLVKNIKDSFKGAANDATKVFRLYISTAVFDWAIDGLFTLEDEGSSLQVIYNSISGAGKLDKKDNFKKIAMFIKTFFKKRIKDDGTELADRVGEINLKGTPLDSTNSESEDLGLNLKILKDIVNDDAVFDLALYSINDTQKCSIDLKQGNILSYISII